MQALKVLTAFPIVLLGVFVGFVYECFVVGVTSGKIWADQLAEKCAKDLDKKEGK